MKRIIIVIIFLSTAIFGFSQQCLIPQDGVYDSWKATNNVLWEDDTLQTDHTLFRVALQHGPRALVIAYDSNGNGELDESEFRYYNYRVDSGPNGYTAFYEDEYEAVGFWYDQDVGHCYLYEYSYHYDTWKRTDFVFSSDIN